MKITISHDQESIDPSASYSEEEFEKVKKALEVEYEAAIREEYPSAEIDFNGTDTTYAVRVTDFEDPYTLNTVHEDCIHRILETVYETGNFWL